MKEIATKRPNLIFIIALLYLLIIFIFTYPLFLNINSVIPGFYSSDESYAVLWYGWRIKYSFINHLSLMHTDLITYPSGIDLYASKVISYIWLTYTHIISILANPVLSYNFQAISNLLFSGLFTYLLVFYITKDKFIGLFSSIIFAFCPYQFIRIWQHLSLSYNQWIVLVIFMAILLKERFSYKIAITFLISLLLLLSFDFSITYLGIIALSCLFFYVLLYIWNIKLIGDFHKQNLIFCKRMVSISIITIIISLPQFLPIFKNILSSSYTTPSAHNPYHRAFEDLFSQSARPLSYLLPATVHPIFGKFTERFIGSSLYGDSFTEHTLYLGWVPLILAFTAFRRWRRNRKLPITNYQLPITNGEDFYIGFFIFLAVVAWFFSQPPWWKFGPIKIFMPSFFMYNILPMYRAYCRFGIVVMLAVAVLAGFGLKSILEKFKTQKAKIAITSLFCSLVLFEFWNYPPFKVIDVSKVPAVYYWLKEEPKDMIIAEYPLDADSPNEMYKFYQTAHEKKIINATIPGTYANKVAQTITKLSDSKTTSILKQMGVKYVLVHHEGYLQTDLIEDREELNKIPENPELKLIKSFPSQECPQKDIMCVQKTGPIEVYEVMVD